MFFENVNVDIRGNFGVAMSEVLGNSLNVKSVVDKQAGVAVSESVNAQRRHIIIYKYLLQLFVGKAPAIIIADLGCKDDVGMYPRTANNRLKLILLFSVANFV